MIGLVSALSHTFNSRIEESKDSSEVMNKYFNRELVMIK